MWPKEFDSIEDCSCWLRNWTAAISKFFDYHALLGLASQSECLNAMCGRFLFRRPYRINGGNTAARLASTNRLLCCCCQFSAPSLLQLPLLTASSLTRLHGLACPWQLRALLLYLSCVPHCTSVGRVLNCIVLSYTLQPVFDIVHLISIYDNWDHCTPVFHLHRTHEYKPCYIMAAAC